MKLTIALSIAFALSACAPLASVDEAWRQLDSYATGQRGTSPDGGAGKTKPQRTERAPTTPN